jgi:hypothetical protein
MRFVDADTVMTFVDLMDNNDCEVVKPEVHEAYNALAHATIYEVAEPLLTSGMNTSGKVLGDETFPPQVRLEARLEAACRLIDSIPWFSIYTIRFVAEQRRFLQELKDSRGAMGRAHRGETGI